MSFRYIPEFPGVGQSMLIWKMVVSYLTLPYTSGRH